MQNNFLSMVPVWVAPGVKVERIIPITGNLSLFASHLMSASVVRACESTTPPAKPAPPIKLAPKVKLTLGWA